jgi:SAM-dependent methyltransferase
MSDHSYREFFDSYAPQYMNEVFTTDSAREVAFLLEVLESPPGATVLDIGCGTGRHAVELARAGLRVTGLDISRGMLREARMAADEAGVELELVEADATEFDLGRVFDAAVCLCEGSFGLLVDDDPFAHDIAVLRRAFAALRPGAPFVLTALNGFRMVRAATPEKVESGAFDPATLTEFNEMTWETEDGPRSLWLRERGWAPTELSLFCRTAGFDVEHVWGGTAGDWGRRPVDLDEYEIMVVMRRPPA